MKITIDVSTMQNRFAACGRDYYSWEGYEALLAYYNDIDPNMELDAVAICGDCTEYGEDACDWSAPNGLTPHGEYDLERRYYY